MKVVFFSNFLNHHQLPLCKEFCKREDVEFTFVATEPISQERINMGYADMNKAYDFILCAYESESSFCKAEELAISSDIMIFGSAPLTFLQKRMVNNKLTFYFCERILKKGTWRRFVPLVYRKIYNSFIRYRNKPLYVLSASAFLSNDLKLCGFPTIKCFKWGYFPEITLKNINLLLQQKRENKVVEILFAGRLLCLKNVLDTVKALKILLMKNITNFHFTIIGEGEQKKDIESYVENNSLQEYVTILPFMSADEVREYMDKANVYVFGSNFYEGWGAVVNEAMNSACALVVSHAVGSAPYLIENGVNGLIYECGNINHLANQLNILIENQIYREEVSINAYNTIIKEWTAEIAVERFLELSKILEKTPNNSSIYEKGVCSSADIFTNKWIKKK